jgi:histone arginine demethylase JMJD6
MEIRRVSEGELTHKEFYNEYWKKGIPLVFKDASKKWKASGTFTPEFFRTHFGDRRTVVNGVEYTMTEILDLVEGKDTSRPVPYPCKYHIRGQLPELAGHMNPLDLGYARPNWLESRWFQRGNWGNATELFIGGPGGQFPYIHIDYYHLSAWINQLYGEKEFTVYPREQAHMMYADPNDPWKSLINDPENPDYDRFPLFKEVTPYKFVIKAGESLYVPFGLWHTARSLTTSMSVAYDLMNAENFPDFLKDVWDFRKGGSKAKAVAITGYAAMAGALCKIEDLVGVQRTSDRA